VIFKDRSDRPGDAGAVLSLVSASWKSSWRMARRTAEVMHFKQRLNAEIDQGMLASTAPSPAVRA